MTISFVPTSKDDLETVGKLASYIQEFGYNEGFVSSLPELIEWTLDPHWPVAQPIGEIIANAGSYAVEPLSKALTDLADDPSGQFGILCVVIPHLPISEKRKLRIVLEDMVASSEDSDVVELAEQELESLD